MDDNRFENDNDLIDDSLEFCEDIYKYYKSDETDRIKFERYSDKKYKRKGDIKDRSDKPVIVIKQQAEDEGGLKLYTKIVAIILFAMIFARVINAYIIQETIVNGSSMSPTLESSDKLLLDKVIYKMDKLKRYDIVVFNYHDSSIYIKRVIGLPGEEVVIRKGRVYVNGRILDDDPLAKDKMHYSGIAKEGVKLGKDEYFVLGDNRNNSYDSRYEQVGVVKKSRIIGKVWIRIFPLLKFGAVN
nr:signal peptidase I [uncultured Catonella sp.]